MSTASNFKTAKASQLQTRPYIDLLVSLGFERGPAALVWVQFAVDLQALSVHESMVDTTVNAPPLT